MSRSKQPGVSLKPTLPFVHSREFRRLQEGIVRCAKYCGSVGVLQNNDVTFLPEFPPWKQEAIYGMNMVCSHKFASHHLLTLGLSSQATYTKIFLRFNTTFWADTQYQIYADPSSRGYFPVWQSLDLPNFLPESHVLLSTVTDRESVRIERQTNEQTQAEMMAVLRAMYGPGIPDPEEMLFKRWHSDPLFRGSYSNWGTSYPPALFDNLRAPLEARLWFAGEATSLEFYGFLQVRVLLTLDKKSTSLTQVCRELTLKV